MAVKYQIDLAKQGRVYPHYWELCIGSCHAATVLREDVRAQIRKAHRDCGFQYLRFHGLFNDDMSVIYNKFMSDETVVSFFNIDSIFDFLLETGMKPFIELGFMPQVLASGSKTCFHYKGNITQPKDYGKWADFIRQFGEHLIARYGKEEVSQWFFEVWNEPNLSYFFAGTQEDYFKLYQVTANALRSVDSCFRVGGPATSSNAWIPEFVEFCETTGTPLDFITTHHYPSDDPLANWGKNDKGTATLTIPSEEDMKRMSDEEKAELAAKFADHSGDNPRDVLYQMTAKAKKEAGKYPLYYTEWNGSVQYDNSYQAAFVAQTLAYNSGLVDGYSFWTVSDIFEEAGMGGTPFKNEFGIQTIHGIAKPVYRVFQKLHEAGDVRLDVEGEGHRTAEVMAFTNGKKVTVFAYNHDILRRDIKAEEMEITLSGNVKQIRKAVIDETHCNPEKKWIELGSPLYLTKQEKDAIEEASKLQYETVPVEEGSVQTLCFTAEEESVTIFEILL